VRHCQIRDQTESAQPTAPENFGACLAPQRAQRFSALAAPPRDANRIETVMETGRLISPRPSISPVGQLFARRATERLGVRPTRVLIRYLAYRQQIIVSLCTPGRSILYFQPTYAPNRRHVHK
jgi:hypothetical protein